MPDARKAHYTYPPGPSLLNQKAAPYNGPAHSLYGPRGPQRAAPDYGARKPLSTEPESIEHHVQDAIARVAGLSPRQRLALRNELMRMTRDISFIRCIHEQAHGQGPHSDQAAGIPMDQGRPL
jgi:hypothetical protein